MQLQEIQRKEQCYGLDSLLIFFVNIIRSFCSQCLLCTSVQCPFRAINDVKQKKK